MRLIGIGVGPGDPELLTLKAVRLIQESQVVAHLGGGLARRIAAPHLPPGMPELAIPVPIGSDAGHAYDEGARLIRAEIEAGRQVAVLCEGDPLLYGSFMYLLARLDDLPVEVVPGVSSVMAATAAERFPFAAGNDSVMLVPATLSEAELERRIRFATAIAVLKVGRHLGKVRAVLARAGLLDHAVHVAWASLPEQTVLPLAEVDEAPYFSLVLAHRRGRAA
jgi:precorrin-2/cobalt-factor-2 C20-methyltransferase